ncbi:PIN domain-containing protein [Salinarimonas rosea]|uniref:PIN domain-containing protein n=1 Tax=Salinarimonas rosea TaxID=552063 RepID=UPI00040DDA37|nr:type II toxin-antitoxin system VapC family toxin [Salinarimonas rosea]
MSEPSGIDTNVLVRLMLEDDPDQARKGRALLARISPILVNPVVLAELFWVLRSCLKLERAAISDRLRRLLHDDAVVVVDGAAARAALADYEANLGDFSDRLIACINEAHGASQTYTFDRKAARHPPLAIVP